MKTLLAIRTLPLPKFDNLWCRGIAAAGVILALPTTALTAELLVNGDFENEPNFGPTATANFAPAYVMLTGNQLPGWTIEPGHGVTIHSTSPYPFISGAYSANMDGEGFNSHNANLYQDFATTLALGYQFGFDWQGWTNSAPATLLKVSIVDTVTAVPVFNQSYAFDSALHHESASFFGTGNALRLRVEESPENGGNDNQFMVDNFSVGNVPEPSAAALLALGAALIGRRRRHRSA